MARGKSEYWLSPDGLMLIAAWTRDGLTDEGVAKKMGVSRSTLSEWKKKHAPIAEAMQRSKDVVDVEVENALYKNAVGYRYTEEAAIKCKKSWYDERGKKVEEEHVEVVQVERNHPAETTAAFIWLKNRRPGQDGWRDKKEVEMKDTDFKVIFAEHPEWSE